MQFHFPPASLSFPACMRVKGYHVSPKIHRRPMDSTPRVAPKCPNPRIVGGMRATSRKNKYKNTPGFPKSMVSNQKTVQYIFHSRLIPIRYHKGFPLRSQVAAMSRPCGWPNEREDTMLQSGQPPATRQQRTNTGRCSPCTSARPATRGFRLRKGGIFARVILPPALA
jgi:hypothetical protein